jgi:hypothetical protein
MAPMIQDNYDIYKLDIDDISYNGQDLQNLKLYFH